MFSFLESPQFDFFTDWLASFVVHQALIAPFVLLLIEESGIPLPVPGDVYLAFVGYQVSKGNITYTEAFIFLLLSVLIGSSILFYVSSRWGNVLILKFGKYLHLNEKKLTRVEKEFKKYGVLVIIFGRHIPGFRIPITVFSGMSGVSYRSFILSTFVSVIFWIGFYLSLGAKLGKKVVIHFHAHPLYFVLVSIPFLLFILSVVYVKYNENKKKKILDRNIV